MEKECLNHDWILMREENFGEMDYNPYGGGVEQFIVRTYVCKNCGEIKKESSGDFNGDSSEFIIVTARKHHQNALHLGGEELLFFF